MMGYEWAEELMFLHETSEVVPTRSGESMFRVFIKAEIRSGTRSSSS
jgi:hypothetical protein